MWFGEIPYIRRLPLVSLERMLLSIDYSNEAGCMVNTAGNLTVARHITVKVRILVDSVFCQATKYQNKLRFCICGFRCGKWASPNSNHVAAWEIRSAISINKKIVLKMRCVNNYPQLKSSCSSLIEILALKNIQRNLTGQSPFLLHASRWS